MQHQNYVFYDQEISGASSSTAKKHKIVDTIFIYW